MTYVLFLDDDHGRHTQFRERAEELGYAKRHRMLYAHSAAEAIHALRRHEGEIVQAFLDHDLSEEDILVAVGAPSKVPTGMAVVEHIETMAQPPASIVVHSYNRDAAAAMCARLARLPAIRVERVPFSTMLHKLT